MYLPLIIFAAACVTETIYHSVAMPSKGGSEHISEQDIIVLVMGPTGSGKSTFIERATRQNGETVGHSWRSHTAGIRSVRFAHPTEGHIVTFVDTPGFDDTFKSNTEIVTTIADWLVKLKKGRVNIAAILYLHRISDNRISGSAMKSLKLFASLCGMKAMPYVVVVTTMWSQVDKAGGAKREDAMKIEVWDDILKGRYGTKRFNNTYESAWDIVDSHTKKALATPTPVTASLFSNKPLNGQDNEPAVQERKQFSRLIGRIRGLFWGMIY